MHHEGRGFLDDLGTNLLRRGLRMGHGTREKAPSGGSAEFTEII